MDLVGADDQVVPLAKFTKLLELFFCEYACDRVVWIAKQEQFRIRSHFGFEIIEIKSPATVDQFEWAGDTSAMLVDG